jgi:flagellin
MRINHNIAALNTHRQLSSASAAQGKSMEKLSSGQRINRAGDDAAGLAISEKMRGQIRGLDQAARNAQDGISLIQTAEGGLNETHDILQRMRELAVQGSAETLNADDRDAITKEITTLKAEVDNIATSTKFNTKQLLNGGLSSAVDTATLGTNLTVAKGITNIEVNGASVKDNTGLADAKYTITSDVSANTITVSRFNQAGTTKEAEQTLSFDASTLGEMDTKELDFSSIGLKVEVNSNFDAADLGATGTYAATEAFELTGTNMKLSIGANNEEISFNIAKMDTTALGIASSSVATYTEAKSFVTALDTAIKSVSTERANLGSVQNRLEHTINNLNTSSENLTAAESRVRDVDYALTA